VHVKKKLYKQYIGLCSYLYNWTCIHDVNFMCLPVAVESLKSQSHIYCHTSCTHWRAEQLNCHNTTEICGCCFNNSLQSVLMIIHLLHHNTIQRGIFY
jgi:hypothetical protein